MRQAGVSSSIPAGVGLDLSAPAGAVAAITPQASCDIPALRRWEGREGDRAAGEGDTGTGPAGVAVAASQLSPSLLAAPKEEMDSLPDEAWGHQPWEPPPDLTEPPFPPHSQATSPAAALARLPALAPAPRHRHQPPLRPCLPCLPGPQPCPTAPPAPRPSAWPWTAPRAPSRTLGRPAPAPARPAPGGPAWPPGPGAGSSGGAAGPRPPWPRCRPGARPCPTGRCSRWAGGSGGCGRTPGRSAGEHGTDTRTPALERAQLRGRFSLGLARGRGP